MKSISVTLMSDRLDEYVLFDVREPHEVARARIDPHIHIPIAMML
ncbi:MAG TPA: hypothetical protein QGF08_01460 [Candidatus Marinimicrobia bacterium]|nr:hypothetical protein [Candidatus Neomarinimicrobiota bacterium]HJL73926.1 hypothetical protein [Candidatus Neomarinimicrobiota bacterium]HJM69530.1 hypothetical protein [Candidatus Neomarinimicrobiota bacterium]